MFGLCRDPLTKEIQARGYSLVRLPDSSIRPLQVLGRHRRTLRRYGVLSDLFSAGSVAVPQVQVPTAVAPISVTRSSWLDGQLGLKLLQAFLGAEQTKLAGLIKSTRRFRLEIPQIRREEVALGALDGFLARANLNEGLPTVDELLDRESIYIVVAVLKATAFRLEAQDGDVTDAEFSIPNLGVGGSVEIGARTEGGSKAKIIFETNEPVSFAFQAVRTIFDSGIYVSLHPERRPPDLLDDQDLLAVLPRDDGWLSDFIGPSIVQFD